MAKVNSFCHRLTVTGGRINRQTETSYIEFQAGEMISQCMSKMPTMYPFLPILHGTPF